jgi:hypothetical protein
MYSSELKSCLHLDRLCDWGEAKTRLCLGPSARSRRQPRKHFPPSRVDADDDVDLQPPLKPSMATLKVLPISLLFSLAVFSSQRSLYPLYGSVPTHLYSLPIICASTALGTLVPTDSLSTASLIASVWLVLSPRIALHVGATTSAKLNDPVLGPVIANVVLLTPLLFASSIVVRRFTVSHKQLIHRLIWLNYAQRFGLERLSALTTHTLAILSANRLWAKNNTLSLVDDDKIVSTNFLLNTMYTILQMLP